MPTKGQPHFLLFAESRAVSPVEDSALHAWRFVLESVADGGKFSASDCESDCGRERAELLAVVRGLEAIDGSSRVTLVTRSRYVTRGLRRGLSEWRSNAWQWERFGQLTEVRDADLWRRIDVTLQFHRLECRLWRPGQAGADSAPPIFASRRPFHQARPRIHAGVVSQARVGFQRARRAASALAPPITGRQMAAC